MNDLNQWHPSWDKWGIIPIFALIVIPLTFGIVKYIERGTQRELAVRTEKRDIRLKYLTIALQPFKTEEQSMEVFRFLVNNEDDTMLSMWAKKELKTVTDRIARADTNKMKLDSAYQKIAYIQYKASLDKNKSRKENEELRKELLAANKEKDDLLRKRSEIYTTVIPTGNLFTNNSWGGISTGSYSGLSGVIFDTSLIHYNYSQTPLFTTTPRVSAFPKDSNGNLIIK